MLHTTRGYAVETSDGEVPAFFEVGILGESGSDSMGDQADFEIAENDEYMVNPKSTLLILGIGFHDVTS